MVNFLLRRPNSRVHGWGGVASPASTKDDENYAKVDGEWGAPSGGMMNAVKFGVRYAEIGFAGANQLVSELTPALEGFDTGAMKLALFGRTRGPGLRVEDWPDVQFMISGRPSLRINVPCP